MSQSASGYRDWFFEQLAMYMAYHRDRRNQATHHVGVPLIVFALLVALSRASIFQMGDTAFTGATVLLLLMALLYVSAVPLVGVCTLIFYGALYLLAGEVADAQPVAVWSVAASAFIGGWIIQFVGHVFEGRRPAFTDNIVQILMAPPFLIAEMLFARGYATDLKQALETRSQKYAVA
jgi:uncharacterized membrane protein YGL010W